MLKCICTISAVLLLAAVSVEAQTRPEADLCAVPPGAQPLLPAKLMSGMGVTNMPVTTSSEEARKFFNQGVSQMHSFWFLESERSFLQAATLDPNMAMAYWGISVSAAGDYRPAFQLIRDPSDGGRMAAPEATARGARDDSAQHQRRRARARSIRAREIGREGHVAARQGHAARAPLHRSRVGAPQSRRRRRATPTTSPRLRKLVAAHPDDEEAASILGLALLDGFDSVTKKPRTNTLEGIALLEKVVAKNDNALRRASLPDSRLRRQRDARARVARLPALSGAGDEHPARAAHARTHLRAERSDRRRDRGVHDRGGERAAAISRPTCSIRTAITATTSTS